MKICRKLSIQRVCCSGRPGTHPRVTLRTLHPHRPTVGGGSDISTLRVGHRGARPSEGHPRVTLRVYKQDKQVENVTYSLLHKLCRFREFLYVFICNF